MRLTSNKRFKPASTSDNSNPFSEIFSLLYNNIEFTAENGIFDPTCRFQRKPVNYFYRDGFTLEEILRFSAPLLRDVFCYRFNIWEGLEGDEIYFRFMVINKIRDIWIPFVKAVLKETSTSLEHQSSREIENLKLLIEMVQKIRHKDHFHDFIKYDQDFELNEKVKENERLHGVNFHMNKIDRII